MQKNNTTKALTLVLVLFCFGKLSKAQTYTTTPSSTFACTIGITATDLLKDSINYSRGVLFNAGFVYSLRLSEKFNTNVELLYSGKAVKTAIPIVKYRYFYADIPLYLQYNFNENIRTNIGAQYSIYTNSLISQIDGSNRNGVNNKKYKNIKSTDYGFLLGAEIDFTEKLTLTIRYTLSTSTFFEKQQVNFGVFNLAFRYRLSATFKQFFTNKIKKE